MIGRLAVIKRHNGPVNVSRATSASQSQSFFVWATRYFLSLSKSRTSVIHNALEWAPEHFIIHHYPQSNDL